MNSSIKYSEVRKFLELDKLKSIPKEDLAAVTHYLQNKRKRGTQYYKQDAIDYFKSKNLLEEPGFQYKLPIEYDVPFPPPKNPKFKFIDLFAGIGGFRIPFQNLGGECVFTQ